MCLRPLYECPPWSECAWAEVGAKDDRDPRRSILGAKADLSIQASRKLKRGKDTAAVLEVLLHALHGLGARVLVVNGLRPELVGRKALWLAARGAPKPR